MWGHEASSVTEEPAVDIFCSVLRGTSFNNTEWGHEANPVTQDQVDLRSGIIFMHSDIIFKGN
jgi:hypothetical protein